MKNMRTALLVSFALNLALNGVAFILCPDNVAVHFGAGGHPNGWAPSYVNTLIMSGMDLLLFASFFFAPQLIRTTPSRWINLPNKSYWLRGENRAKTESILAKQMAQFGTLTFVFMFITGLLALQANLSNPVRFREDLFWWPFGLYMAYMAYWTVKILFVFRIPKSELHA